MPASTAGDKDRLVARKFRRGLTIAQQYAAARNRCFIKRGECWVRSDGIRFIKTSQIGPEHEDFPVSQKCGAGRGRVHVAVNRKRVSRGIEFLDRIECVSAEEEQTGIAQGDRFLAGVNCRHHLRIERELLVGGGEQFHRIRISAGKQNAVVGK